MQDELLPTKAAAKILGVTASRLNQLVNEGRIEPAIRVDGIRGARFFHRSAVEALAAERAGEAEATS